MNTLCRHPSASRLQWARWAVALSLFVACGDDGNGGVNIELDLDSAAASPDGTPGAGGDALADAASSDAQAPGHDASGIDSDGRGTPDGQPAGEGDARRRGDTDHPDAGSPLDTADAAPGDTTEDTAGPSDAQDVGPAPTDADAAEPKPPCEEEPVAPFDYGCSASNPSTCPGGICLFGLCLGPVLDPDRWADCGDGVCDPCEYEDTCPADCAPMPEVAPAAHDSPKTISIWAHGFRNVSDAKFKEIVYGSFDGCGGVYSDMAQFGESRPCAEHAGGDAPNHYAKAEYFGVHPAPWLTAADIAEIEAYDWQTTEALMRYALIVAKFIRWRVEVSGAEAVNIGCHSMGCLIFRTVIEHDLEHLASDGLIARWVTSGGVIAGARLARLYDNPSVQGIADALGLGLVEFAFMHPDFVMDHAAWWDHRLYEGNSPHFRNIPIHHHTGSDPKIKSALNVQLLDLDNPGDEPNDGIMYTADQRLHSQGPLGTYVTPSGTPWPASYSISYIDHENIPKTDAFAVLVAAGLYHGRRVRVVLEEVELYDDMESKGILDGNTGTPPAELYPKVRVRYDPYTVNAFGKSVLVHVAEREHRTPEVFIANEGELLHPEVILFEGPVFDDMTSLALQFDLVETDWYPRFGVLEWALNPDSTVLSLHGQVPLVHGEKIHLETEFGRAVVRVDVVSIVP